MTGPSPQQIVLLGASYFLFIQWYELDTAADSITDLMIGYHQTARTYLANGRRHRLVPGENDDSLSAGVETIFSSNTRSA